MTLRRPRIVLAAALLFALGLGAGETRAAELRCADLDVPAGIDLTCRATPDGLTVGPPDGPYASLTRLSLSALDEAPDDAAAFLRQRVRVGDESVEAAADALFDSPDSPFNGTDWADLLQSALHSLDRLTQLPLEGCTDEASGVLAERAVLRCAWQLAGLAQYYQGAVLRLNDRTYVLDLRAMNAQRFRHLRAIANSLGD